MRRDNAPATQVPRGANIGVLGAIAIGMSPTLVSTIRKTLAATLIACGPQLAAAQVDGASAQRDRVAEVLESLNTSYTCEMIAHGEPRLDEPSRTWLVAYSASGDDCDAAAQAIQRQGASLGLTFFRRPTLGQARALIAEMKRSAEAAFGCRITLRGDPQFNEISTQWTVAYLAAGTGCEEAAEELRREGAELQIFFMQAPSRQELIR